MSSLLTDQSPLSPVGRKIYAVLEEKDGEPNAIIDALKPHAEDGGFLAGLIAAVFHYVTGKTTLTCAEDRNQEFVTFFLFFLLFLCLCSA